MNTYLLRRGMLTGLLLSVTGILAAQTIFQNALHLNALRSQYAAYCQSIYQQDQIFSTHDRNHLMDGDVLPVPFVDNALRTEIKAILNVPAAGSRSTPNLWPNDGKNPNPASGPALEAQIQNVAEEWALIEEYLHLNNGKQPLNTDDMDHLTAIGGGFNYLDDISRRVTGQAGASAVGGSSNVASLLGINEAEILMGIVDWSLKQAEEELMKAFLAEWLTKIESDSTMLLLFPNTLNLLRTSDITTVFTNGDVWKAAFKKDLDVAPEKLPQMVALLLRKLHPGVLDATEIKEIEGAARIAAALYQDIGNGNTIDDVLSGLSDKAMLAPKNQLSVIEKGTILSNALLQGITVEEHGKLSFASPHAIAQLDSTQLLDLWNLMFISLEPMFDQIFAGTKVDSIYQHVAAKLPMFKYALGQLADIVQTIQELTAVDENSSKPASKRLDLQETDRYFKLSLQIVDNSIALMDTFHILPAKDIAFYKDKARPIAVDVMNAVESVETQQYGALVTSMIDIVERLNLNGSRLSTAVMQAAALLPKLREASLRLSYSSDLVGDVAAIQRMLIGFNKQHAAALAASRSTVDFGYMVSKAIAALEVYRPNNADPAAATQKFVGQLLNDLENELRKVQRDLASELGNTLLGHSLNTYGRFIVNLLAAKTSKDVETILDEFTNGSGGYMVKQTSRSALTVTLLPGLGAGIELPMQQSAGFVTHKSSIYAGASLPLGLEYSLGIRNCKVLGAVGFYGQVADLGTLLSYRLTNPDTLTPQISFQKVLSPGFSFFMHGAKVPIVLGLGVAYSPALAAISRNATVTTRTSSLRLGATLSVDVTAFQLWASKHKINPGYLSLGQR